MLLKPLLKSKTIILKPSSFADCELFAVWESKDYVRTFFTMNDSRDYEEITREFVIRDCVTILKFSLQLYMQRI